LSPDCYRDFSGQYKSIVFRNTLLYEMRKDN
jgi:hypothetical protein